MSGSISGEGIPPQDILKLCFQFVNLALIGIGAHILLKDMVKEYFSNRRREFKKTADLVQQKQASSQREHDEVHIKLTKLEHTALETVEKAKAEAADMKKELLKEAEVLAERIRSEAQTSARAEVEKARALLRETMISEAVFLAEGKLKKESDKNLVSVSTFQNRFVTHAERTCSDGN